MEPRLEIKFLRDEPSKIWVKACNESFAGETEQYINAKWLQILSEQLAGFPNSNLDEVIFEVGEEGSTNGYCKFKFYCFDSAGHAAVLVSVSNELAGNVSSDNLYSASFKIQFEASSLDSFTSSLNRALIAGEGTSMLKGINAYTQNI